MIDPRIKSFLVVFWVWRHQTALVSGRNVVENVQNRSSHVFAGVLVVFSGLHEWVEWTVFIPNSTNSTPHCMGVQKIFHRVDIWTDIRENRIVFCLLTFPHLLRVVVYVFLWLGVQYCDLALDAWTLRRVEKQTAALSHKSCLFFSRSIWARRILSSLHARKAITNEFGRRRVSRVCVSAKSTNTTKHSRLSRTVKKQSK